MLDYINEFTEYEKSPFIVNEKYICYLSRNLKFVFFS